MARIIFTGANLDSSVVTPHGEIPFTADRGQFISDEISDEAAAYFAEIPGYVLAKSPKPPKTQPTPPAPDGAPAPPSPPATPPTGEPGQAQ